MKKKFVNPSLHNYASVCGYTLPKYHEGKQCYVDWYFTDAVTGEKRRKKCHFDHIKNKKARRAAAQSYILSLMEKLLSGVDPNADDSAERAGVPFTDALLQYEKSLSRFDRYKTRSCYRSRVKVLREYLSERSIKIDTCGKFDRPICVAFLDWVFYDREVSARTRNNYLGWLYSLAEFLKDRGYIAENPVAGIRKLPENEKCRRPLTESELHALTALLEKTDRPYLLACLMMYYTFVRPNELVNLRVGDISLKDMELRVSESYSKNRKTQNVALNERLVHLMLDLGVFNHNSGEYLFSRGFLPGPQKMPADIFNRRWGTVRRRLGLDSRAQFYSLKGAGIRDLANQEGIVVARDQARHRDVATTNRYLAERGSVAPDEPKKFRGHM
ncbi:MAG: tyrosine-type recombinase/integrase [Muribaculaceae bacterium]|nr:tyrosine-type recombinase/integrase [Muribaculaceae bacterium]